MLSAAKALERLRAGNRRFVAGNPDATADPDRRRELRTGQAPFAVILGCSDSRVPAEIVFDQGLGDLFVIRVAGNIAAPSQIGSVEFAADVLGTRLVVVLGHQGCGAVEATLRGLLNESGHRSENLRAILDRVRPAIEPLVAARPDAEPDALLDEAVRANVRASLGRLRNESEILQRLIEEDGLLIAGAEYHLESGRVEFFEGLPKAA